MSAPCKSLLLFQRKALYFQYCITARFRFSPAPSSAEEVEHIYQSFQHVAPLDYFKVHVHSGDTPHTFGPLIDVVFNPTGQASLLDPFNDPAQEPLPTVSVVRERQRLVMEYLRTIGGLPRFSILDKDKDYLLGEKSIVFKHKLQPLGRHLEGSYEFTEASLDNPFFLVKGRTPTEVLPHIRHNFQKHHKIRRILLQYGPGAFPDGVGASLATQLSSPEHDVYDISSIIDTTK